MNQEGRPVHIPLFLQSELERLASALNLDFNIGDESGEAEYLYLLDRIITKVEDGQEKQEKIGRGDLKRAPKTEPSRESQTFSREEQKLLRKTMTFESDISRSIAKADEGLGYQEKINRINMKFQKEKEQKKVLETYIKAQDKKLKVLIEHVEKLMKMIKIESSKRLRCSEENLRLQKEGAATQQRIDKQARINGAQHKAIRELTEGSKVLEDQLQLMDEKYVELKSKFDIAREQYQRKLHATMKQNDEMRVQLRMMTGHRGAAAMTQSASVPVMSISIPNSPQQQQFSPQGRQQHHQQQMYPGNSPFETAVAAGAGMNPVLAAKRGKSLDITAGGTGSGGDSGRAGTPTGNRRASMAPQELPRGQSQVFGQTMDTTGSGAGTMRPFSANNTWESGPQTLGGGRPQSANGRHLPQGHPQHHQQFGQQQQQQQDRPATSHGMPQQTASPSSTRRATSKQLNQVMHKITKHSGKKSVWNAERLSDLLESCT